MFASSKLFTIAALLAVFIGLTWAVPVTLPSGVNPGGPNIPVIPSVLPSGNPGLPTIPSLPTGVPQIGEELKELIADLIAAIKALLAGVPIPTGAVPSSGTPSA